MFASIIWTGRSLYLLGLGLSLTCFVQLGCRNRSFSSDSVVSAASKPNVRTSRSSRFRQEFLESSCVFCNTQTRTWSGIDTFVRLALVASNVPPSGVLLRENNGVSTSSWNALEEVRVPLKNGEWLTAQHVVIPETFRGECYTLERVGLPSSEGLVCIEEHSDPLHLGDGRSLLVGGIYILRHDQLIEVLRIALGTGPMDDERCVMKRPCAQQFYVRLVPQLQGDGRRLRVIEDSERPCNWSGERLSRIRSIGPKFLAQQQKLDRIACAERGEYVWVNGRYVKVSAVHERTKRSISGP